MSALAEVLWASVDGKGIRGRLYREDCDYLAEQIEQHIAAVLDGRQRAVYSAHDIAYVGGWNDALGLVRERLTGGAS